MSIAKGITTASFKTKLLYSDQHAFDATEQDNIAQITVDRDSILVGLQITCEAYFDADNEQYNIEFSTNPNYQGGANGAVGMLCEVTDRCLKATSGMTTSGKNLFYTFPYPIPFKAGEKIYLNGYGTSGLNAFFRGVFFFRELSAGAVGGISRS